MKLMGKKNGCLFLMFLTAMMIVGGLWYQYHMKEDDYHRAIKDVDAEVSRLNKYYGGKEIHANTRLDSAGMKVEKQRVVYELTLLDVTSDKMKNISNGRRDAITEFEKKGLVKRAKSESQLYCLLMNGWTVEYIQRTRDGMVINHIIISQSDVMGTGNASLL